MSFECRVFTLPKDTEHPEELQDAYAVDPARGVAVVADGVASAIFSRQWAGILAEAALADPPNPDDKHALADWLARCRRQWSDAIDTTGLAWFQKAKMPTGAFSTLLCVRLLPSEEQRPGTFGALRLSAVSVGDSCLFHVRGKDTVRTFPVQKAEELESHPVVLGSVDLQRDELYEFRKLDVLCYEDDLLVVCTDAVADWALRRMEADAPADWDRFWEMDRRQWEAEIARLREAREMRYDDATLLMLRVLPVGAEVRAAPSARVTAGADDVQPATGRSLHGLAKWKDEALRKYREKFTKGK